MNVLRYRLPHALCLSLGTCRDRVGATTTRRLTQPHRSALPPKAHITENGWNVRLVSRWSIYSVLITLPSVPPRIYTPR